MLQKLFLNSNGRANLVLFIKYVWKSICMMIEHAAGLFAPTLRHRLHWVQSKCHMTCMGMQPNTQAVPMPHGSLLRSAVLDMPHDTHTPQHKLSAARKISVRRPRILCTAWQREKPCTLHAEHAMGDQALPCVWRVRRGPYLRQHVCCQHSVASQLVCDASYIIYMLSTYCENCSLHAY